MHPGCDELVTRSQRPFGLGGAPPAARSSLFNTAIGWQASRPYHRYGRTQQRPPINSGENRQLIAGNISESPGRAQIIRQLWLGVTSS